MNKDEKVGETPRATPQHVTALFWFVKGWQEAARYYEDVYQEHRDDADEARKSFDYLWEELDIDPVTHTPRSYASEASITLVSGQGKVAGNGRQ
jgi:hypothetical protein